MKILFAITLLFITTVVHSQSSKQVLDWINTVHTDNHRFYFEIPFEYRNNEIVIQVTIGNGTYDYIFDSGGYNDITDSIQGINHFPVLTTQTVGSSNQIKASVKIVKVDSLKIGGLVIRDVAALQMNFDNSPTIKCIINGALIGASIIKNYIWQIDFSRKIIIVSDELSRIPLLNKSIKIPVNFNNRLMPFIDASIDGKKEKFMFDLGSSSSFSLTEKSALKLTVSKKRIEIEGLHSEGGNGVLVQTVQVFKADSIDISGVVFKNKPVSYSSKNVYNLIGNPVIKYFIVTLNFKDNELYLSPIPGTDLPDGWNSFGFAAEFMRNRIVVTSIFKGLAADKAGLRIDDEIETVNGQPLNCKCYCDCKTIVENMLEVNEKLVLEVRKGETLREITVIKEKVY